MESFSAVVHELPMTERTVPTERPLKVLHVASGDLWAGAEAQIYTLLYTLASRFSDVQVVVALMNEGELADRLRQRGIEVHVFDERKLGSVDILMGLRRLMRAWHPDIVHTHRIKENILGALANRTTWKVPCVRTAHGASERARGLRETLLLFFDRWCARHLQQRIIAVSADLARQLAMTFAASHIAVIENGIDSEEVRLQVHPVDFRLRAPHGVHVGLAGRLVAVKRVDLFIAMAALLQRRHPGTPWHFHVFGDGPLRVAVEVQARLENGLEVTFHGHRSDIVACLAALDVLVMCSDHEGMPMTALESMAVGTRIVAHAVGGLVEVLTDMNSAKLVEEQSPDAYAEAVWDIVSCCEHSVKRQFAPKRLSAEVNAARTLSLYRELSAFERQSRKA